MQVFINLILTNYLLMPKSLQTTSAPIPVSDPSVFRLTLSCVTVHCINISSRLILKLKINIQMSQIALSYSNFVNELDELFEIRVSHFEHFKEVENPIIRMSRCKKWKETYRSTVNTQTR